MNTAQMKTIGKKSTLVGSEYQADVPDGLSNYDDALPYENDDKLLWDPKLLSEKDTESFLRQACYSKAKSKNSRVKDDEQALFLLLQCGHNTEEALRRRRINTIPTANMSLWSEEECKNFESGLLSYGKDFYLIQQNNVRTRSVGELVQFYYLWKKSERHDIFASKARFEKKKYILPAVLTDYMDRFLEETDASLDRSSSPNVAGNTVRYLN